jgi:hypothetical protein
MNEPCHAATSLEFRVCACFLHNSDIVAHQSTPCAFDAVQVLEVGGVERNRLDLDKAEAGPELGNMHFSCAKVRSLHCLESFHCKRRWCVVHGPDERGFRKRRNDEISFRAVGYGDPQTAGEQVPNTEERRAVAMCGEAQCPSCSKV